MFSPLANVIDLMFDILVCGEVPLIISLASITDSRSGSLLLGSSALESSLMRELLRLLMSPRMECGWNIFQSDFLNK